MAKDDLIQSHQARDSRTENKYYLPTSEKQTSQTQPLIELSADLPHILLRRKSLLPDFFAKSFELGELHLPEASIRGIHKARWVVEARE